MAILYNAYGNVVYFQTELNKANDEILARREIKKEQEKAEEMKVIEYMKQKAVSYLHVLIWNQTLFFMH